MDDFSKRASLSRRRKGVRQGIIISGLNHAIDHLNKELFNIRFKNQLTKAGYNLEDPATIYHEYIQDMIEKVPILKKVYNKLSNENIKNWILGEDSPTDFGAVPFKIDANNSVKSYKVKIYKIAFSSNLRLAGTLGHEMQHIIHINNGFINKYLKYGINYAIWKSEIKAYSWDIKNFNKIEGINWKSYYEHKLYKNYYE